jgi:hypothetical protein
MPNGGIPIHMLLRPKASDTHVMYCHGAELKVIRKDEWERAKSKGDPEIVLDREEAQVLERFLRYWLQDSGDGPLCHEEGIDATFDF